ncbi:hypothetical protein EJ08DRAFT_660075 [Tothia fuscella]|uniref:Uncharacterized protein n=1 Tax=Tothia fuscella TaxID=1048955 RepID=A0A9P4NT24_9PEZI|nr:hypothetical protein EJ08DRAFT_660075 [Tothia fuscella]
MVESGTPLGQEESGTPLGQEEGTPPSHLAAAAGAAGTAAAGAAVGDQLRQQGKRCGRSHGNEGAGPMAPAAPLQSTTAGPNRLEGPSITPCWPRSGPPLHRGRRRWSR